MVCTRFRGELLFFRNLPLPIKRGASFLLDDSKNSNTHSKTSSQRRQEVGGGPLCKRLSLSAFREIGLDRHTTNGKGKQRWRRSPEWARDLPKLESTREKTTGSKKLGPHYTVYFGKLEETFF